MPRREIAAGVVDQDRLDLILRDTLLPESGHERAEDVAIPAAAVGRKHDLQVDVHREKHMVDEAGVDDPSDVCCDLMVGLAALETPS